jgi:Double zinc ribbon
MELDNMIDLAKSLGGIFLAVFYVAIVLWTYKDARRRIDDPILVATAVATSMLPIIGVFVYMLLRPPEYIADVRERELEIRAMERALGRQERCPYCKSHIEGDYLSCPVCMTKLRQECTGCDKPLDPKWVMCPYCETEVPRSQREGSRPGRGGARPAPTSGGRGTGRDERADRPRGGDSRGSGSGSAPTKRPEPRRGAPSSTPRRDDTKRPSTTDKGSSKGVDTEPFAGARGPRFVRSGDVPSKPAGTTPGSPSQPTMVTPGPGRTDPK